MLLHQLHNQICEAKAGTGGNQGQHLHTQRPRRRFRVDFVMQCVSHG
jgi:hypothetical protein